MHVPARKVRFSLLRGNKGPPPIHSGVLPRQTQCNYRGTVCSLGTHSAGDPPVGLQLLALSDRRTVQLLFSDRHWQNLHGRQPGTGAECTNTVLHSETDSLQRDFAPPWVRGHRSLSGTADIPTGPLGSCDKDWKGLPVDGDGTAGKLDAQWVPPVLDL